MLRVSGERRERGALVARIHVVEQHSHPDAAVGGEHTPARNSCRSDPCARCSSNIQAALRQARALHTAHERFRALEDQAEGRLSWVFGLRGAVS